MHNGASRLRDTILSFFETQSRRDSPLPALLGVVGQSLSYGALAEQIRTTVLSLNGAGIGPGDRVAVVLPNGPEMAACFLSVATTCVCAPLNPAYRADEFDFYLDDLDARALVVMRGMASDARRVAERRRIPVFELVSTANLSGQFELETGARPAQLAEWANGDDVALVLHTSGTTSRPKMVPLTHSNLTSSAQNIQSALKLTAADCCLNMMPLFHIHGLIGAVLSSISAGASVVCTPGFEAPRVMSWLDELQPTWYTAVPTMHQAILARATTHGWTLGRGRLRLIRSSSAALPPQVMVDLEEVFGVPVIESYGMTEATHQMTSNPLPPRARKPGSVGVPAGPEVVLPSSSVGEESLSPNHPDTSSRF